MNDLLERETFSWKAHAHIDRFTAAAEREALHTLFPVEAALIESLDRRGARPRGLIIPHVSGDQMQALNLDPFEVVDEPGNLLVNAGINRLGSLLIGSGGQAYDATHTAIGVGDTATAAAATDTDLAAAVNAANRYVQVADASFPTFATQVLTVKSTFPTGNGNFAWAEWAIGQNTASAAAAMTAPLLNRKVAALGTKTSASAWAFTVTVTLS